MSDDSHKNLRDRLQAVENSSYSDATKEKPEYPTGWKPGLDWEGNSGVLTTPATSEKPTIGDWEEWMRRYGLDPEIHEIVDDKVRFTAWDGWRRDGPDEEPYMDTLYSFKATVVLKREYADTPDLETLYQEVKAAKPSRKPPPDGDETMVVALSDWQVGTDEHGGAEATLNALNALINDLPDHINDLRKAGHNIGNVCLAGLGDLHENCYGFYPYQQFSVVLSRRDQMKMVRRALRDIIMTVAPVSPRVTVTAVGGNHGENRSPSSKGYITSKQDNDDVAVFEAVSEAISINPDAFGHVSFHLPDEELAVALNLSGNIVGFTHGHITGRGTPIDRMWRWWHNQAFGRHYAGVADAEILVAGHFHHLNFKQQEGRTLFIAPALTKVGDYFADSQGVSIVPGTLTFLVGEYGWNGLTIL